MKSSIFSKVVGCRPATLGSYDIGGYLMAMVNYKGDKSGGLKNLGKSDYIICERSLTSRKLMTFGLMKLIKKSSSLSILCIIICKKMKRSYQGDLDVLGKLNYLAQNLFQNLSVEVLENQSRSKISMKK